MMPVIRSLQFAEGNASDMNVVPKFSAMAEMPMSIMKKVPMASER